jgi:hypothetical protein
VAAGGSARPVELDHPLAPLPQEPGQPGPVAAGALDRPDPSAAVLPGQVHEGGVAVGVGGHGPFAEDAGGGGLDDRGGVGVLVPVDPHHDVDGLCQHGHAFISFAGGTCRSPVREETAGL